VACIGQKSKKKDELPPEILHQIGDHAVVRMAVGKKAGAPGSTLKSAGFWERGLTVLAIEKENSVIQLPDADSPIQPEDYLFCYGETAEINNLGK
jgi:K+/H+ antiporter YhaU regulatory subunit KhtT